MNKIKETALLFFADSVVMTVLLLLFKNLTEYARLHHTSIEILLGGSMYSSLCWLALMFVGLAMAYHGLQLLGLLKTTPGVFAFRREQ